VAEKTIGFSNTETTLPPNVTVDANVLFQSFPRYLCLRLHEHKIITMWCSNLIWEECARKLLEEVEDITETKIGVIGEEIVSFIGGLIDLRLGQHSKKILEVHLSDPDDKHVLHLASITNSKFLVTENLQDFPEEQISYNRRNGISFHPDFEVVSFDMFLCSLIQQEHQQHNNCDGFLVALAATMVPMRRHSAEEILRKLDEENRCPNAYKILEPHTEKIAKLVEQKRKAL